MKKIRHNFATCKRRKGETPVQNGLAVTPAQVLKMAESGLPASAQMNSQMIDGHEGSDWIVPLDEQRGIDIAQMWQASKDAHKKFRAARDAASPETPKSE